MPGPPPPPPPSYPPPVRRSRGPVVAALAGVVLLLLLAVTATATVLVLREDASETSAKESPTGATTSAPELDRSGALAAARNAVPAILGYTWRTFDADVAAAKALMAPEQARRYTASVGVVRAQAVAQRYTVVASARGAGLVGIDEDRAQVLAFTLQVATRGDGAPTNTLQSVVLSLERVDGTWLVANLLMGSSLGDDPGEPDPERASVLRAASAFAQAFTNLDHRTVEADTEAVLALTTGAFRTEYADNLAGLRRTTTEAASILTGRVVAAGIEELAEDHAVSVVATTGTVANDADDHEETTLEHRLRVTLDRVDGVWLVSGLELLTPEDP